VGQLGDGSQTDSDVPALVSGGITFQAVSAGGQHSCGVGTDNVGYCWGRGDQLGDGSTADRFVPGPITGGLSLGLVSAGNSHSCAVATGGEAYCWGDNNGALGNGSTVPQRTPVLVLGGLSYQAVSVSQSGVSRHTCGFTTGGIAYCWGVGGDGKLGTGTESDATIPVKVIGQ
jgi:alpha-tubulin suppressor-like RCC1 family protein